MPRYHGPFVNPEDIEERETQAKQTAPFASRLPICAVAEKCANRGEKCRRCHGYGSYRRKG